jgi:MFS family permease
MQSEPWSEQTALGGAANANPNVSIEESVLYRRVATKVVPLLMLGYFVSYVDRVNVGFAKLQMLDALGLSEAVYGVGAAAFFWGYLLMQVPASLAIYRFGVKRCLPLIMVLWGVSSAAMTLTHSPTSFYLLRFLLGVCEAGFFPAAAVYLSSWFPPYRHGKIMSIFFLAMPLGIVTSGPLAGWIMSAKHGAFGLMGWQWLFLIEAIPAVLIGIVMRFRLEGTPRDATWLTPGERIRVLDNVRTVTGRQTSSFVKALGQFRLWHLVAISLLFNIGNWGLVFWMPTIVKAIGDGTVFQTGLLTAIPYAAASITMWVNGSHAERHREIRWHTAIPVLVGGIALAASAATMRHPLVALVLLSIAASGLMATLGMFWSLPTQLLTGTAAAGGVALVNAASSLAGIVGPIVMGLLTQRTHSTEAGVYALAAPMVLSAILIFLLPRPADA